MQSRFRFTPPTVAHLARQACFGLLLLILSSLACAAPVLTISPAMAPPGAQVTLTLSGASFSTTPANNVVSINGVPAAVPSSASATQLVVTVPTPPPDVYALGGYATVTVGATTYVSSAEFTLQPQITGISPAGGPPGTRVTITGTGFIAAPSADQIYFYNAAAGIVSASSTQLVTTVPGTATSGQLWVTVGSVSGYQVRAASTINTNFVVGPLPIISSIPSSATIASTVTITGSNFGPNVADNAISINGYSATVLEASPTQLKFLAPSVITTGAIKLTVYGGLTTSSTSAIRLLAALQPTCGSIGSSGDVAATATSQRVYAYGVQSAAGVTFTAYPTPAAGQTTLPSDAQSFAGQYGGNATWYADVPLAQFDAGNPRYGSFTTTATLSNSAFPNVACGSGTSWNWLHPAPVVKTYPSSATIDSTITITGSNFGATAADDVVSIGGASATILSADSGQITLRVPSGIALAADQLKLKAYSVDASTVPLISIGAAVAPTCASASASGDVAYNATTQRIYAYNVQNATGVAFTTYPSGQSTDSQTVSGTYLGNNTWFADFQLVNFDPGNPRYGSFSTRVALANSAFSNVQCATPTWNWVAPVVIASSPASAPIDGTFIVTGSNFSANAANDTVSLLSASAANATVSLSKATVSVKATVLTASTSRLEVRVPSGIALGTYALDLTANSQHATTTPSIVIGPAQTPTCTSAATNGDVAATQSTQRVYAYGVSNATAVSFATTTTNLTTNHVSLAATSAGIYTGNNTWYADVPLAQFNGSAPIYGSFTTKVSVANSVFDSQLCATTQWNRLYPQPTIQTYPASATIDSTIAIGGLNFGDAPTVTIGGVTATFAATTSDTLLKVYVPSGLGLGPQSLSVTNHTTPSSPVSITIASAVSPTCGAYVLKANPLASGSTTQRVSVSGVQNATTVAFKTSWLTGASTGFAVAGTDDGNGNWHADITLGSAPDGTPAYGAYETDVSLSNSRYANIPCNSPHWKWSFPQARVTSLDQLSGPIYDRVTINGSNFSYALADDVVMFNGTPAAVLDANSTQLTVAVPTGATTGPVAVTVDNVNAAVPAAGPPVFHITPLPLDPNDWVDVCAITDPKIQRVLQSEALVVPLARFDRNADGSLKITAGNYTLNTTTYAYANGDPNRPLADGSLFKGEMNVLGGQSGFLIGPNLFMTTNGPNTAFDPSTVAVVFGFSATSEAEFTIGSNTASTTCEALSPTADGKLYVPADAVFLAAPGAPNLNSFNAAVAGLDDYRAFTLAGAPNRPWLRLRTSGAANSGDAALVLGHPEGLATKLSPAAKLFGAGTAGSGPLINGDHTHKGSEGSMVYNLAHEYVEAAVSTVDESCAKYVPAGGTPTPLTTLLLCPTDAFPVNSPVTDVSAQLPSYALVVAPQGDVTDKLVPNASAATTYTLTAPATARGPINWSIVPPWVPAGAPTMTLSPAMTSGTLAPGASYSFTATVGPATQTGKFDETLRVYDASNGFVDSLTHHITVANPVSSFEVSLGDFVAQSLMQPPPYATNRDSKHPEYVPYHDYLVSNKGAVALTMTVASDSAWLSVTGPAQAPAGVTVTVNSSTSLTLAMDPGSSTTIRTGLIDTPDLDSTPLGVQRDGNVTFTNTSPDAGLTPQSETRAAHFTPGLKFGDQTPLSESLDLTVGQDAIGAPLGGGAAVSSSFNLATALVTLELTVDQSGETIPVQVADFPYFGIRLLRKPQWSVPSYDVWTGGTQVLSSALFSNNVFHGTTDAVAGIPADGSTWEVQIHTLADSTTAPHQTLHIKSWSMVFQGK